MKKILLSITLVLAAISFFSFSAPGEQLAEAQINWYTWEEAIAASEEEPKKLFIDMYTDWCGWCKKMDKTTFRDEKVVKYINEHFYPVKFDAEQKEEIIYDGHSFKFVNSGRKGYHQLAAALLDGRMGYPSYVYMDEEQRRITVSPGYKPVEDLMTELTFIAEDHYQKTTFKAFAKNYQGD